MRRTHALPMLLAVAMLATCGFSAWGAPITLNGAGTPRETALSVNYDVETGRVLVTAPEGFPLTAIQLLSASQQFTSTCESLGGAFDLCTSEEVFKVLPDGFPSVELGQILSADLAGDGLLADLLVNGATVGGGFHAGDGPLLVHADFVPEPSSGVLLVIGGFLFWRRRRRSLLANR